MKRFLQTLLFVVFTLNLNAQTPTPIPVYNSSMILDSTQIKFNFRQMPWYVRVMPLAIYTGPGKNKDRMAQYIEVGKSFNIIDLGVSVGRNSLRPDTTTFVEGKITMDIGNFGIFANEMTVGAGRLFDKQGSLMLELSYNIFAQVSKNWGFGIGTGFYDFSNENFGTNNTFFSFFLRYGAQRSDSGGLLGLGSRTARVHAARARHIRR